MQKIDPVLQSQVWGRVMATVPTAGGAVSGQELLELMQAERASCLNYRRLSCRVCGADARTLRQMAAEEACHEKKLRTMYYLLVGGCPRVPPAESKNCAGLTEALRQAYEGERRAAETYEAMAARWPDMADEFHAIADDELCHSKQLRAMLCRLL